MRPNRAISCCPLPSEAGIGFADVRIQSRLTGKCHADVIIQHGDFPDRPRILQLQSRLLLNAEDNHRLAADSDLDAEASVTDRFCCGQDSRLGKGLKSHGRRTHSACSSSDSF